MYTEEKAVKPACTEHETQPGITGGQTLYNEILRFSNIMHIKRLVAAFCTILAVLSVSPLHARAENPAFSDVPPDSWAAGVIDSAVKSGLMGGMGDGLFGYGRTITRAEFVTVLCRMFGWEVIAPSSATFGDVSPGQWFYGAIEAAAQHGVVEAAGRFRPNEPITRKDMAVMLVKALGYDELAAFTAKTGLNPFVDVDSDIGYIIIAHDIGMINGIGEGKFAPDNTAKREEAAAMLTRVYDKMKSGSNWLHGFYAFSSYGQRNLIDGMDAVSFGWSKMEWDADNGARLNTTALGGNTWRIPESYELITEYQRNRGVKANLCVFMDTSGGLYELLADEASRKTAAEAIMGEATREYDAIGRSPYDGVTVDFEGLRGNEAKTRYTAFLSTLAEALKERGLSLYVTVQPVTADGIYFDGYDYREIGRLADKVILMAHNYQPVSLDGFFGTEWQRNAALTPVTEIYTALKAVTDEATGVEDISKVALAFSFGCTGWKVDENNRVVSPSPVSPSIETVYTRMLQPDTEFGWSDTYRNSYMIYTTEEGERIFLWYEDSRSITEKLDLAKLFGVTGSSIWRLGIIPDFEEWNVMGCFS